MKGLGKYTNEERLNKMSRRNGKFWKWLVPSLGIVLISALLLFNITGFGGTNNQEPLVPDEKENYAVFSVDIPVDLTFAGEKVPLEYFDVRESLDRELLSNMYFHSQTIRLIKLSYRYFPGIEAVLREQGIPDDFKYLAIAESGLENVVSPAGAVGFWQIRKGTGTDYDLEINSEVDERYHLEKSTEVACRYLNESFEKYGNWTMSAASYNAGRRGVDRQIERQKQEDYYDLLLNEETARYLFRIIAIKLIFENPSEYGFNLSFDDMYKPIPYTTVIVDSTVVNLADFAIEHNTNYKMLKILNPWLRDNVLTNTKRKSYEVRIPERRNDI